MKQPLLTQNDGSWRKLSENWPSYHDPDEQIRMWVIHHENIVPYGAYVTVDDRLRIHPDYFEAFKVAIRKDAQEQIAKTIPVRDEPIPMILFCPECGTQHIDRPEVDVGQPNEPWGNPPHRSHLCVSCGCIWRPADVPTVGVEKIETHGQHDTFEGDHGMPMFGPCYSERMGKAAEKYLKSVGPNAHPLPAQFRWCDLWHVMLGAAVGDD